MPAHRTQAANGRRGIALLFVVIGAALVYYAARGRSPRGPAPLAADAGVLDARAVDARPAGPGGEALAPRLTLARALEGLDAAIGFYLDRARSTGPAAERATLRATEAYLERARLSLRFDDLLEARAAFAIAAQASLAAVADAGTSDRAPADGLATERGLVEARLLAAVGKLRDAAEVLDGLDVVAGSREARARDLLRADVDLAAGRLAAACNAYGRLVDDGLDAQVFLQWSRCRLAEGDPELAERLLEEAARLAWDASGLDRAALELAQAELCRARGDLDGAGRSLGRAHLELDGWPPLLRAEAELALARGDLARAEGLFRRLVDDHRQPAAMDGLALVARRRGDEATARTWAATARTAHEARLRELPELAAGEAVEHFLVVEPDAARALAIVEPYAALREGGPGRELLVRALLAAGELPRARAVIEPLLSDTRHGTPGLHALAAEVFERTGDPARAAAERAKVPQGSPTAAPRDAGSRE